MRAVETVGMLALMLMAAGCVTWLIVQVSTRPAPCQWCAGRGCLDCVGGR